MILWTFQPYSVYEELMETGEYICNPKESINLVDDDVFFKAYQWMIQQMKFKIGNPPAGVKYPVWAWYRWSYKHQPPEFDSQSRNNISVCMKIKIPDDQVVLSDFDHWHHVLNQWYLGDAKIKKNGIKKMNGLIICLKNKPIV